MTDLLLWGTGGPLMYMAITLALLAAVFAWTVKSWWEHIDPVPLNHVAEQPYARTYRPSHVADGQFAPVFASSASALTAVYHVAHVPAVYDPRTHRLVRR